MLCATPLRLLDWWAGAEWARGERLGLERARWLPAGVCGLARAAQASVGGAGRQTFSSPSELRSVGTRGVR